METGLKQFALLFLTAALAAEVRAQFVVNLTAKVNSTVKVPAGSSVTLNCDVETRGIMEWNIEWYFRNKKGEYMKETLGCNKMKNLSHVNETHSGSYACIVIGKIPKPTNISSTYSELNVSNDYSPNSDWMIPWWMWIILGLSLFFLIILTVVCCLIRKRCLRSKAEPIYINTKNRHPSPRPVKPAGDLHTGASCQRVHSYGSAARNHKDRQACKP